MNTSPDKLRPARVVSRLFVGDCISTRVFLATLRRTRVPQRSACVPGAGESKDEEDAEQPKSPGADAPRLAKVGDLAVPGRRFHNLHEAVVELTELARR